MRRWLTLLLLVVLPLQLTWAAAAAYCQHEASDGIGHVGHHVHEHPAAPDGADGDAKSQKQAAQDAKPCSDNDCGFCQLGAAKPLGAQAVIVTARAVMARPPATPVQPLPTRDPDRLERPNWRLA